MNAREFQDAVMTASPERLRELLVERVHAADPLPFLNERDGDAPETIFITWGTSSPPLRERLDAMCCSLVRESRSDFELRAAFALAEGLALGGAFVSIQTWLHAQRSAAETPARDSLANSALAVLASNQVPSTPFHVAFWSELWRDGPVAWRSRAYLGLRVASPSGAVDEIPRVIERYHARAWELLVPLWRQPTARAIFETPTSGERNPLAIALLEAIKGRVPELELAPLARSAPPPAVFGRARRPTFTLPRLGPVGAEA